VQIYVVRELKKGRQKVQFDILATDGAAVDDEDGTKNSTAQPGVKQVLET